MTMARALRTLALALALSAASGLLGFSPARAQNLPAAGEGSQLKVAVLELASDGSVSDADAAYLTDLVRGQAGRSLPASRFLVMTRENVTELLPPGTDLKKCTTDGCEVEIARKMGADYVVTGDILSFAGERRVVLKAHHAGSGAFVGEQTAKGKDLMEIESAVKDAAGALFAVVKSRAQVKGEPSPAAAGDLVLVRFESKPSGAAVLIGGETICGETPCGRALPPGASVVAMTKEGYFSSDEPVIVRKDMPPIRFELKPRLGVLKIVARDERGNDIRGRVMLDGDYAGDAPGRISAVIGQHRVAVETDSGAWEGEVTIAEGQQAEVAAQILGFRVMIRSNPPGASVTHEGQTFKAPQELTVFREGIHEFTVEMKGYPTRHEKVLLRKADRDRATLFDMTRYEVKTLPGVTLQDGMPYGWPVVGALLLIGAGMGGAVAGDVLLADPDKNNDLSGWAFVGGGAAALAGGVVVFRYCFPRKVPVYSSAGTGQQPLVGVRLGVAAAGRQRGAVLLLEW